MFDLGSITPPWEQSLSIGQHDLVLYAMVVAGLALFAQFVRTWTSIGEVGARYRPAMFASLCVTGVAFLSYVYLVVKTDMAYVLTDGRYEPVAGEVRGTYVPRYMDWSVTVPLLMVQLVAVSALVGAQARRMRSVLMVCAFAMIFTGFLGAAIIGEGRSQSALLWWGVVSTVFYVVLYVLVLRLLPSARTVMGSESYVAYRNAIILLLSVWGWYPVAYAIHNWLVGPGWTTTIQVGFCAADVAAKVGFGVLIHKVARLRTAEDVRAGEQAHPEEVWISSVKHSDGVQPALKGVIEDGGSPGHHRREPVGTAPDA